MDIAIHLIGITAAVADCRHKDITAQQLATAVTAGPAPASCIVLNAGSFHGNRQGFAGRCLNDIFVNASDDGQFEGLCFAFRIAFRFGDIHRCAEDFHADALFRYFQFCQFTSDKLIHRQRSADEVTRISLAVLFDQFGAQEAFFTVIVLPAGNDIDDLDSLTLHLIKNILENDIFRGYRTVQDRQIHIQRAVIDFLRHRHKRCDTGAAGQGYDVLRIPHRFIEELTERHFNSELITFFYFVVEVIRDKAVVFALADRDFKERIFASCLKRRAADRERTGRYRIADLQILERYIHTGLKRRQFSFQSLETECFRRDGSVLYRNDADFERFRMHFPGDFPDRVAVDIQNTGVLDQISTCVGDAGGAQDILQKTFDFHIIPPPSSIPELPWWQSGRC